MIVSVIFSRVNARQKISPPLSKATIAELSDVSY